MKKTLIFTGGHDLAGDDLLHTQDGLTECIMEVVKALGLEAGALPNMILSGCEFTNYPPFSIVDIAPGAVILDGEICLFEGINTLDLDVSPDVLVFTPVDTYLAGNPVLYKDASLKDVNLIRKAEILQISGAPAANQLGFTTPYLSPKHFIKLAQANLSVTEAWHAVGAVGEPAEPTFNWYNPVSQMYFRKNILTNTVEVRGEITFQNLATEPDPSINYAMFQMPAGYHPAYEIPFVAPVRVAGVAYAKNSNGDRIKHLNMNVDTNGYVCLNPETVAAGTVFTCRFYAIFSLA